MFIEYDLIFNLVSKMGNYFFIKMDECINGVV